MLSRWPIYTTNHSCQEYFLKFGNFTQSARFPKITPCSNVEDLRPISLTSVLCKVQESYVVEWVHEDIKGKVSEAQFGGLPGSSAVLALVRLAHNWYSAMENQGNVVRIIFLDFRKAFDLIDHNKLLQNFEKLGVRPALLDQHCQITSYKSRKHIFRP